MRVNHTANRFFYEKAFAGVIEQFTALSDPYDEPPAPLRLVVSTRRNHTIRAAGSCCAEKGHGIQAVECNGGVYIAAGGKTQGGGTPTNVHEAFFLNSPTTCEPPTGDTTPITVASMAPQDGATGVSLATDVTATFSEAMDAQSITGTTFTLSEQDSTTPVNAAVSYDAQAKKVTLDPDADLEGGATYTATIKGGASGVKDAAGNALANDKVWSFTTAAGGPAPGGLKGQYYDNQDFTDLKLTRTDPKIEFNWGTGSPDPSIDPDTFSVRWSGQIKADHTETYTFYAVTNDGVKLWVNDQLVINRWSNGSTTTTGTIALEAGKWYPITMEYFERINSASAKLEYSSASTPRQVVPSSHLSPPDATPPAVDAVTPAAQAKDVPVGTNLEATFSQRFA